MRRINIFLMIAAVIFSLSFFSTSAESSQTFSLQDLAKYNGQNGNPAYIGLNGKVYDISNEVRFQNGVHVSCAQAIAGTDVTKYMSLAPRSHRRTNFMDRYPIVGVLSTDQSGIPNNPVGQQSPQLPYSQGNFFADRDIIISTGWIAFGMAVIIALISQTLKYFKLFIKHSNSECIREFTKKFKRLLHLHCILGFASLMPLVLHIYNNISNIRFSVGWILFVVYILIIFSGTAAKYFKIKYFLNKTVFRLWHGGMSVLFTILGIIHIFQQLS